MRILNFGSLNLDEVYQVPRFVRPGETLGVLRHEVKAGGKGLNQSIALARAGAEVWHAGCMGHGGERLRALLRENGVNDSWLLPVDELQGSAMIQVDPNGENAILLFGGSNRCLTEAQIDRTLDAFSAGDWLLLQNEVNLLPRIVERAWQKGMRIILNPSPYDESLAEVDFRHLSWILVNEIEAEQLTGRREPEAAWAALHARWPALSAVITLGSAGSMAWQVTGGEILAARQEACPVQAVDTTGAGDTYTGYFISGLMAGLPLAACMRQAAKASAIAVTRLGAAEAIPDRAQVDALI